MTTVHRITNQEYAQLFDENAKVELLEGIIYDKMNVGDAHVHAVNRLNQIFAPLWDRYVVSIQNPLKWDGNEPEPDVAIYRPCRRQTPEFCELVIEVADSTLHFDRTEKIPAYLSQGLTVWIVNLPEGHIEIYRPGKPREDVQVAIAFGVEVHFVELVQ